MKTILSILVALGIPAAFWNYYLKETPDVQYSISASIPLAFDQTSNVNSSKSEYVQQIEVANSGKGPAENVVIKLSGSISQFYLAKHSVLAESHVVSSPSGFELSYPNLPPSTGFQLTVKTSTDLSVHQVDVFHQGGKAKFISPGSNASGFGILDALWALMQVAYIYLMYVCLKDEFRYRYSFRKYSPDVSTLLNSKRPWYISKRDWPEVLKDLIARSIASPISNYSPVPTWPQYILLNAQRHVDLEQSTWDELREMATTRFLDALKVKARQSFSKEDVHDILAIQWPAGVSEANRESVVKTLSDVYLEFVVTTSSNKDLVEILSADCKPSLIARKSWDQFKSRAELEVMKGAVEKLVNAPSINIESFPEWGVLSSLNKFKLSTLSKLQSKAQEADEKLDSAQKLSDRADAIERSVSRREMEAELSEHRNQELGKKVICQLDLIDKLITDPSYIDRIEPYDDTFTSGNWDILRKLAAISLSDKARN